MSSLSSLIRRELVHLDGVGRLHARRFKSIYTVGEAAASVYLLESGLVKVFRRDDDRREIVLNIIGSGELFGEQCLLLEGPHRASAEVLRDAAIYSIPAEIFLKFCEGHPEMWILLAQMLARRQASLQNKIEALVLKDVEQRLISCLLDLAEICGRDHSSAEYSIPLSQEDVAKIIGATRETTSNKLNGLARKNLIHLGRRRVILTSLDALRTAANQRASHQTAG